MVELTEKEKEKWEDLRSYLNRFDCFSPIKASYLLDYIYSEEKTYLPTGFVSLPTQIQSEINQYLRSNKEYRLSVIDDLIEKIKRWYSLDIFVIGCGGVGGYFTWVSAKGDYPVNRLFLIDDDVVERKNVIRQVFRSCDVGKPKVEALREIVEEINPKIKVFTVNKKADEEILSFVKSIVENNPFSFVIIATDTLKSKKEIYEYLMKDNKTKNVFIVNNDRDKAEIKNILEDYDVDFWGEDNGYQTDQNFLANIMSAFLLWEGVHYAVGVYIDRTLAKEIVQYVEKIRGMIDSESERFFSELNEDSNGGGNDEN